MNLKRNMVINLVTNNLKTVVNNLKINCENCHRIANGVLTEDIN